jgi:magnesium transporter
LREINRATEVVEDQLQKSTRNREVLELLKYQKCLTYFSTALRSNEVMMERVQKTQIFNYYEEDQDLLEDVLTENQQAIQMTSIATEILSGMMDAFASIISNNLNGVMKALAALTIILNMPAIVAAFYGMNVALPGEGQPFAFLTVIGISLVLTAVATYIFYKRDWF